MHRIYTFEQNNSSTLARCYFCNIHSLCLPKQHVCEYIIYLRKYFVLLKCSNDDTGVPICTLAELPYCGGCVFVWQKCPAGFRTAGMAQRSGLFQNVSRWNCQKRKQQKICLVTELYWRAGKPPEAPTEPPAYYPFLLMSILHLFFLIMASLIFFFTDYKVFNLIR